MFDQPIFNVSAILTVHQLETTALKHLVSGEELIKVGRNILLVINVVAQPSFGATFSKCCISIRSAMFRQEHFAACKNIRMAVEVFPQQCRATALGSEYDESLH